MKNLHTLKQISHRCRLDILEMSQNGGTFIGAAYSCIDVLVYVYTNLLDVKKIKKKSTDRDIFILSKGHGVAALYSILSEVKLLDRKRLSHHLSTKDNIYWHPNLDMPGIEFHTGSLGHGLTIGIGMAFESKIMNKNNKTIVVMGDGELNEGSVWESLLIANAYQLKNLIVIVDRNLRQANKTTEDLIPLEPLNEKFEKFGWDVFECNGHDFEEINSVFASIKNNHNDKPKIIITKTIRGKGIKSIEDDPNFWFGDFNSDQLIKLKNELVGEN